MAKPKVPAGLKADGRALWSQIIDKYDLRVDELHTLEDACQATDRIAKMRRVLGDDVTSFGSTGQLVVHPLIPEIRATESQVASLLAKLKLPDDQDGAAAEARSTQARKAAQTRWAQAHGASA